MADLSEQIEEAAKQPASGSVDGQAFAQHNLKDQIEADKYLAAKKAAGKKKHGIVFSQLRHPGAP